MTAKMKTDIEVHMHVDISSSFFCIMHMDLHPDVYRCNIKTVCVSVSLPNL